MNAISPSTGVAGATLEATGLPSVTSDASGYFNLESSEQGTYAVRLTSSFWVDRQTHMNVPGPHAEISLIPGTFDLQYFNEMCRGFGGRSLRWTTPPVLVVEDSVLEYSRRTATDERVPEQLRETIVEQLRATLSILSAGRFADFASIERRTTPAGGVSSIPAGAIALTWQRGLLEGFGHVAYGSRSSVLGNLNRGEVALDSDWHIHHLPAGSRRDYSNVVQHELGHSLGYNHTTVRPSFMYDGFLMGLSGQDLDAFKIFFQRPSGNQAPDTDPLGSSLNIRWTEAWSELTPIP